jgi:ABC-type dipeptide/oligopeptide/nickel transport system permease subunit
MSGMIQGTRVAMMVGVISMSIAVVIGILLGSLAGYYGDTKLKMSRIRIYMNILFFALGIFYAFMVRSYVLSDAFSTKCWCILCAAGNKFIRAFCFHDISQLIGSTIKENSIPGNTGEHSYGYPYFAFD